MSIEKARGYYRLFLEEPKLSQNPDCIIFMMREELGNQPVTRLVDWCWAGATNVDVERVLRENMPGAYLAHARYLFDELSDTANAQKANVNINAMVRAVRMAGRDITALFDDKPDNAEARDRLAAVWENNREQNPALPTIDQLELRGDMPYRSPFHKRSISVEPGSAN